MTEINKTPRTTIKTVARDAGVSVSAVSKVLRNAYGVSDSLREKVEASIRKLDYRPNTAARGMRGKTFTIGLLVSDLRNPFVPDVMDGVREAAEDNDYRVLIGVGRSDQQSERALVETMIDQQMDGLIMIGPRSSPKEIEYFSAQIPTVCLAYHYPETQMFDTVNSDDVSGAKDAVTHLIETGHKHISMISLNEYAHSATNVFSQREIGYKEAMSQANLQSATYIHRFPHPVRRDPKWVPDILDHKPLPDAFFCWSDIEAIALMATASAKGYSIPDDFSIVGFDDAANAALPQVALSTVHQNGFLLGETSVRTLIDHIEGRRRAVHNLISTRLVKRGTVAQI